MTEDEAYEIREAIWPFADYAKKLLARKPNAKNTDWVHYNRDLKEGFTAYYCKEICQIMKNLNNAVDAKDSWPIS